MKQQLKARQMSTYFVAMMAALFLIGGQARGVAAVTVTNNIEGSLVKGSLSEVYFVGTDNRRYVFPSERVFYSWYNDFSTVKTVSDETLAAYQIGGNVTYRPGTKLIKIQSDPKVYAVGAGGKLRWVASEDVAKQLYGDNWAKQVDDVPVSDFTAYQTGDPVNAASDYNASSEKHDGSTIGGVAVPEADTAKTGNAGTHGDQSAAEFKIVSVSVKLGVDTSTVSGAARQTATFDAVLSQPPTGARLTVMEKSSGAIFYNEPVVKAATTESAVHAIIGNGAKNLKATTNYVWKLVAYAAPNATAAQIATKTGDFSTLDAPAPETTKNNSTAETPLKVDFVKIDNRDLSGHVAEDVRTFTIVFNRAPVTSPILIVKEKNSDATPAPIVLPTNQTTVHADTGTTKLKSGTTYGWKIFASTAAMSAAADSALDDGEFTTTNFSPTAAVATYSFCPTGDNITDGCCVSGGAFAARPATLALSAGALIRGTSSPTVYYYASNNKRYVMTGKDVMNSWYGSSPASDSADVCKNVMQLPDSEVSAIPLGGNVAIRPGTLIIKIASDPKLYVIARNRTIRPLASSDIAAQIYPIFSTKLTKVIPDAFFSEYTIGATVNAASDYDYNAEYDWAAPNTMDRELGI